VRGKTTSQFVLQGGTRCMPTRVRRWLPKREAWYYLMSEGVRYTLFWKPCFGVQCTARTVRGLGGVMRTYKYHYERDWAMKKLKVQSNGGVVPIGVTSTSVLLGKLPKLREHLTCTTYDDGTIRLPGYMWIKTTITQWVITVFEPDACARMDVRGSTLDDVLMLTEKLLGAEDAPWEVDSYLQEKAAKRTKKKRA